MTHPKLATARSGYGGRGYYIPSQFETEGKKKVRTIFPSVTTVLKQVAKPGLNQWVADQVAAFAVANVGYLQQRSEEVGWGFLRFYWSREPDLQDPLRSHHDGVRDDAAEIGTNLHEYVEAELGGGVYPEIKTEQVHQMIEAIDLWLEDHIVTPHHSEFTVYKPGPLGYAGTGDAIWTIQCIHDDPCLGTFDPVVCLIDLKTSRHTWDEHGMQLAALANAEVLMVEVPEGHDGALLHESTIDGIKTKTWWIEEDLPSFEKCVLLHIRPNDLDTKGEFIPAFCQLKDRTEDLDLYWSGFMSARGLADMQYQLKARAKARRNGNGE